MNENINLTIDLKRRMEEISKEQASKIDPKNGTSIAFLQYFGVAGWESVKKEIRNADEKMSANNERYSPKVAREMNISIEAERDRTIKEIEKNVNGYINRKIDEREKRIDQSELLRMRESGKELLQYIRTLLELGYEPSEREWKLWGEQFAGNIAEQKVFSALAKTKGKTILLANNPEKSIENLETFRQMANIATSDLKNADNSITALSFLKIDPNSPLGKLIHEIDTDIASIIPAEKLTVLKRLKDAKENAFDKNNVKLSVKIGSFIDKNIDKLATPQEINEALYAEAEDFIKQGMTATRE